MRSALYAFWAIAAGLSFIATVLLCFVLMGMNAEPVYFAVTIFSGTVGVITNVTVAYVVDCVGRMVGDR